VNRSYPRKPIGTAFVGSSVVATSKDLLPLERFHCRRSVKHNHQSSLVLLAPANLGNIIYNSIARPSLCFRVTRKRRSLTSLSTRLRGFSTLSDREKEVQGPDALFLSAVYVGSQGDPLFLILEENSRNFAEVRWDSKSSFQSLCASFLAFSFSDCRVGLVD